ncbi:unnamed protein product, partial [Didymodactylos carnosus]
MNALISLFFCLFSAVIQGEQTPLKCDFEPYGTCTDFILDSKWGVTNGQHPLPLDHDHTYNNSTGHYIFYIPDTHIPRKTSIIRSSTWIQPPSDRAMCLQFYYFNSLLRDSAIDIDFVRGDQGEFVYTVAAVQQQVLDWTLISIPLPSEKFLVQLEFNSTLDGILLDDLSIDNCIGPLPLSQKTIYSCDFESDCDIQTLPYYLYQWENTVAGEAHKKVSFAPQVDHTTANETGHYLWSDTKRYQREAGASGYFYTLETFQLPPNETYCLNFYYYTTANPAQWPTMLRIWAWTRTTTNKLHWLWPYPLDFNYKYAADKWTWAIVPLPAGKYSLLFRIDDRELPATTFSVDD